MKPLALDLYCGKGGWTRGLQAAGWRVIGYDIAADLTRDYPGELVLQDVATIDGTRMRGKVQLIVASPPCQAYSYRAMPWKRAKALPPPDNTLFEQPFRIAKEAGCPVIVENVKGAQPWVGRAKWHYGSFYLWGDVPALMPPVKRHVKVDGFNFHQHEKTGKPGGSFQSAAVKNTGGSWFNVAHNTTSGVGQNPVNGYRGAGAPAIADIERNDGTKQGGNWWHDPKSITQRWSSRSSARKEASAQIAVIPFDLARWIGEVFYPRDAVAGRGSCAADQTIRGVDD